MVCEGAGGSHTGAGGRTFHFLHERHVRQPPRHVIGGLLTHSPARTAWVNASAGQCSMRTAAGWWRTEQVRVLRCALVGIVWC